MLTDPLLIAHTTGDAAPLIEWRPPRGSPPTREIRRLLLLRRVEEAVNRQPWTKAPGETPSECNDRRRQFVALLSRFRNGDMLTPQANVKALKSTSTIIFKDLVEFRSGPPDPQTRLLAYVYAPGVWIGLGFHMRSDLGDFGAPGWTAAAQAAKAAWDSLFGVAPHAAEHHCATRSRLRGLLDA